MLMQQADDNAIPRHWESSYSCFDDTQAGHQEQYTAFTIPQYDNYYNVPTYQPDDALHQASLVAPLSWNGAYLSSSQLAAAPPTIGQFQPNIFTDPFYPQHHHQL